MSEKKRQALRNFYNLPIRTPSSSTVSTARSISNGNNVPLKEEASLKEIDPVFSNADFDLNDYLTSIHQKLSPNELLQRQKQLVSSIQELSGDHKSLVYNHYTHLLHASSAIESLSKDLNDLLPQLQTFQEEQNDNTTVTPENSTS
ncbi:GARP complex subunit Vps51 [Schizosaccharomyces cryophilus OY26]|uniref:GARP complex subunit Vps51 n=1 Tax=Schizosaccharomyces cryophilus (strain OY26 / ATCC MYA-4695 / CBS 11777 / NBRC 106824 / NRRL Y48691) TaxID=653667 RepID=S9XHJ5_SCHCR|nr:GARP complex subunit Vps51 [Schizosaccharomyces cryophilus OY26]EPY53151.1 GARP complex subunit Vps51 [Schizosaccharomyces cryophilus OY26]